MTYADTRTRAGASAEHGPIEVISIDSKSEAVLIELKRFLDTDHSITTIQLDRIKLSRTLESVRRAVSQEGTLRKTHTLVLPSVSDERAQGLADSQRGDISFQSEEALNITQDIESTYRAFEASINRLVQDQRSACEMLRVCLGIAPLVMELDKRRRSTLDEWLRAREEGIKINEQLQVLDRARPAGPTIRNQIERSAKASSNVYGLGYP